MHFFIATSASAVVQAVDAVKRVMAVLEIGEEAIFRSELSLQEALLNSYLHGNGADPAGKILISCRLSPVKIQIEVEDEGGGFRPDEINSLPDPAIVRFDGRGLFLIRQLMDSVTLKKRGTRICMSLVKE